MSYLPATDIGKILPYNFYWPDEPPTYYWNLSNELSRWKRLDLFYFTTDLPSFNSSSCSLFRSPDSYRDRKLKTGGDPVLGCSTVSCWLPQTSPEVPTSRTWSEGSERDRLFPRTSVVVSVPRGITVRDFRGLGKVWEWDGTVRTTSTKGYFNYSMG